MAQWAGGAGKRLSYLGELVWSLRLNLNEEIGLRLGQTALLPHRGRRKSPGQSVRSPGFESQPCVPFSVQKSTFICTCEPVFLPEQGVDNALLGEEETEPAMERSWSLRSRTARGCWRGWGGGE